MALPKWINGYLREEGLERIETAVRHAEKRTRGEIVPMVVRQSGGYGHAPLVWTALALATVVTLGFSFTRDHLPWGSRAWMPLDLVALSLIGSLLAKVPALQRLVTPKADRERAALLRAQTAFHAHGLDKTKGSSGILLFMSLHDRQAVVLADKAIADRVPHHAWDKICVMLLRGASQRDLANGYQAAIAESAKVLEKYFPAKSGGKDELRNQLIIEE